MQASEVVEGLAGFVGRGAGTDAERRAADWLADRLRRAGQEATVETFWCRPNWALAHGWHAALGVAGSLISLASPAVGVALLATAIASVFADWLAGRSLGRQLTPERASQNVVLPASADAAVRLILTANYDAGRVGMVHQTWLRRPPARLRRALAGLTPGWQGWLVLALTWLLAIACLRLAGHTGRALAVAQLPPTAALLLAAALLAELGRAPWSPAAGDNATGVAVALAMADGLAPAPPRHLTVELVLGGAGDSSQLGLSHHLRRHRHRLPRQRTIVLGLAACAGGRPRWWVSDGSLIPLRYARPLRRLAERVAGQEPGLRARPHRGRGSSPALPARIAGIPAVTLGCLDDDGLVPGSHRATDTAAAVDPDAMEAALAFGRLLVEAIDAAVGELRIEPAVTPA